MLQGIRIGRYRLLVDSELGPGEDLEQLIQSPVAACGARDGDFSDLALRNPVIHT